MTKKQKLVDTEGPDMALQFVWRNSACKAHLFACEITTAVHHIFAKVFLLFGRMPLKVYSTNFFYFN